MPRRRAVALLLGLGALVALGSRRDARRDRVSLFYADGSAVTFEAGSPQGDRLLALAGPALQPR